jgi:hypothetical protein
MRLPSILLSLLIVFSFSQKALSQTTLNLVLDTTFEIEEVEKCEEGMIAAKKNEKWGFLDLQGNVVVNFKYNNVRSFSEGLAACYLDGKWGYINPIGEVVIDFQYTSANDFQNGLALVTTNKKKSLYIDKKNGKAITKGYTNKRSFSDGYAKVGRGIYLNTKGKKAIEPECTGAGDFKNGLAVIRNNKKLGVINTNGEVILPCIYENFNTIEFRDGYASIKKDRKWGLADTNGNIIIDTKYDLIRLPSEGLVEFKQGDFWGYLNLEGQVLIEPRFSNTQHFSQ